MRNQLLKVLGLDKSFLSCCFQNSLSFAFDSFTVMCLHVNHFEFILLGIYWTLWIGTLLFFIKFGEFSAILQISFLPLLSLLSCDTHYEHIAMLNDSPSDIWGFVHFLHSFSLFLKLDNLNWCIFQFCWFLPAIELF